jgi:hypothetical protein
MSLGLQPAADYTIGIALKGVCKRGKRHTCGSGKTSSIGRWTSGVSLVKGGTCSVWRSSTWRHSPMWHSLARTNGAFFSVEARRVVFWVGIERQSLENKIYLYWWLLQGIYTIRGGSVLEASFQIDGSDHSGSTIEGVGMPQEGTIGSGGRFPGVGT